MTEINWDLLKRLSAQPHPLLNIADDVEKQVRETPTSWTAEVFEEARTAHHLLDMAGIPRGAGYSSDLDARTYLAVDKIFKMHKQLDQIATWHSLETGEAGTIGDFCRECGEVWPCKMRRAADGWYEDDTEPETHGKCKGDT